MHRLVLLVAILPMLESSMVQLNSNGYEHVVIAINPAVPEDDKMIDSLKAIIAESSEYLFRASRRRIFIRSVKILTPNTWRAKHNYSLATTETYEKADVIVADRFLKYGDDPYTLQYGGCGEPGRYIHFTPAFLRNDALLPVYGPRGRVFAHEWAHLRWGVFDEYNNDQPFYVSEQRKVEATRCSADVSGVYKVHECKDNSCSFRDCKSDSVTGLYENSCLFIPFKTQNANASIMYMQGLTSVVEFCDGHSHNIVAPNLQNRLCGSRSTWDVIMGSSDFRNNTPMSGPDLPAPPSVTVLRSRERVVCLVLDVSGSTGTFDRLERERQAAALFLLQILEPGSHAGIVTFDSKAYVMSELRHITNDTVREELVADLPKDPLGGTNICAGLRLGFQVSAGLDRNSSGTEIILLSDGEDDFDTSLCFPDIKSSGAIIHVVALGPFASKALGAIADMTGGRQFFASDEVETNGLIDAFSSLTSSSGDLLRQAVQLESTGTRLNSQQCLKGTVTIDRTVGNDTFFEVTWETSALLLRVEDPNRKVYNETQFAIDPTTKNARLRIPGSALAGDWRYSVCNPETFPQAMSITVTTRAASATVPPLTVNVHMSRTSITFPEPMMVYAQVSHGFLPITEANVTAIIGTPSGEQFILPLADNGAGADVIPNDGIYSRIFGSFKENGKYSIKVRVGRNHTAAAGGREIRDERALYMPGYVLDNGIIEMNPARPSFPGSDLFGTAGAFSRTASGDSFTVSGFPLETPPDVFPPSKVTDLRARINGNQIVLTWTAPGGDLDQGQAARYDIRMSTDPLELRDNFEHATSINASAITPQPSGSRETFSFAPESLKISNGTILYFSMRAIDSSNLMSSPSNIAQAALLIPSPEPLTTTTLATTKPQATTPPHKPELSLAPRWQHHQWITCLCLTLLSIILMNEVTVTSLVVPKSKRWPSRRSQV